MSTNVAMGKGRARPSVHHTLSQDSESYLKKFNNQSKVIDEALELHRVKDKLVMKPIKGEVISVV